MNRSVLVVLALLCFQPIWAQSNETISDEYNRISLTILGSYYKAEKVDNQYNINLKTLSINGLTNIEQVDYNYVPKPSFDIKYSYRNFKKKELLKDGKKSVDRILLDNNIGQHIVSYILNRDKSGYMNTELIEQRGLYNATIIKELKADATFLGKDVVLRDQGYGLLQSNYIVFLDKRYRHGQKSYIMGSLNLEDLDFRSDHVLIAYVYKLKFDDSFLEDVIYNQAWLHPTDNPKEIKAKNRIFNNIKYEYEFVDIFTTQGWNSKESEEEVLLRKITNGIRDFGVTTPIYNTKPIMARIGTKESVKNNDRFYVYEFKEGRDSEVRQKRVAVIRAAEVDDNTSDNSKTTQFVKVAGGALEEGYTIQKRDDAGLTMGIGYSQGALDGYKLSWSWLLKTNISNTYSYPITTITFNNYNINDMGVDDYESYFASIITYDDDILSSMEGWVLGDNIRSTSIGFGYGVGYRVGGNFEIEARALYNLQWLTGADFYGLTSLTNEGNTTNYDGGFQFGVNLNANIYYPLKLFVSADYYSRFDIAIDEITSDLSKYYRRMAILEKCGKTFNGLSLSVGLSYTF